MEINQIIKDVEIVDYTYQGYGISKKDEETIFVKGALIGEIVNIQITEKKRKITYAEVVEIKVVSKDRVEPKCPNYNECGGCNMQHMSYEHQQEVKNKTFKNTLHKSNLSNIQSPIIKQSNKEYEYRNKVNFAFLKENNQIKLGFKKEKSHEIINIQKCDLVNENINNIKDKFLLNINETGGSIYKYKTKKGDLEEFIIRENSNGELLLILKLNVKSQSKYEKAMHLLLKEDNVIKVAIKDKNNEYKVYENTEFLQTLGNFKYKISPDAFFQVNHQQTLNIYDKVLSLINKEDAKVLDAYCGTGTIGQYVSQKSNLIIGMEINKQAVKDAKYNAKINAITNSNYIQGDINKNIEDIYLQNGNVFDVVILDPPRRGIPIRFINLLLQTKPQEIIYVSCQPSTLIRDLELLQKKYKVLSVDTFDMFPQTHHIETVVKLELDERN